MSEYLGFAVKADNIIKLLEGNDDGVYVRLHIIQGSKNELSQNSVVPDLQPIEDICTLYFYTPNTEERTLVKQNNIPIFGIFNASSESNERVPLAATDHETESTNALVALLTGRNSKYIEISRLQYSHLAYNRTYNINPSTRKLESNFKTTYDYTYYSSRALLKICRIQDAHSAIIPRNKYLIFSGSSINGGQGFGNTDKEFFTLKVQEVTIDEPDVFDIEIDNVGYTNIKINTLQQTDPSTTFGIPCPPDWYYE